MPRATGEIPSARLFPTEEMWILVAHESLEPDSEVRYQMKRQLKAHRYIPEECYFFSPSPRLQEHCGVQGQYPDP